MRENSPCPSLDADRRNELRWVAAVWFLTAAVFMFFLVRPYGVGWAVLAAAVFMAVGGLVAGSVGGARWGIMTRLSETDFYQPIKEFLGLAGDEVKAEVGPADVVAMRPGEEPVIVELKTGFSLTLLQQATARQRITDTVYVAVPRWRGVVGWRRFKANLSLCRRLGLGVISVRPGDGFVEVHCDPLPYTPRKSTQYRRALLSEFERRVGDPNQGGSSRRPIMTAYRQDAIRCAEFLAQAGPSRSAVVAKATGVKRATRIMSDNHYGWFRRVAFGTYDLTERGRTVV